MLPQVGVRGAVTIRLMPKPHELAEISHTGQSTTRNGICVRRTVKCHAKESHAHSAAVPIRDELIQSLMVRVDVMRVMIHEYKFKLES